MAGGGTEKKGWNYALDADAFAFLALCLLTVLLSILAELEVPTMLPAKKEKKKKKKLGPLRILKNEASF